MHSTKKRRRNSRGRRRGPATPAAHKARQIRLARRSTKSPSPIPPPSPSSMDTITGPSDSRSNSVAVADRGGADTATITAVPRVMTPTLLRKDSLFHHTSSSAQGRKPTIWISALQHIAMVRDGILDTILPVRREYRRVAAELAEKEDLLSEVTAHNERLQGLLVDALANQREDVPTTDTGVQTDERLLRTALAKPRRTRSHATQTHTVKKATQATQTAAVQKAATTTPRRGRYNVIPAPVFQPTKTASTQTISQSRDTRSYKEAVTHRVDEPLPAPLPATATAAVATITTTTSRGTGMSPQPTVAPTTTVAPVPPPPAPPLPPTTTATVALAAPPPPPPMPLKLPTLQPSTPTQIKRSASKVKVAGSPLKKRGVLRPLNFSRDQLTSARLKPVTKTETPSPMKVPCIEASAVQRARLGLRKTTGDRSPGGTPRKHASTGGGTGILPSLYAALVEKFRNVRSPSSRDSSTAASPA
ncbi:hypothetical protein PTSG_11053 [Salpingoeca rosetta]|uniref:Uncharacterized protein n=1 Tax=Salpingoeca rosetta (strain ATCC 50818 / BSB-021) TaxID=946362 RepID=F2US03_SALR5|nr:uncharacterized protein PTSG_11053 [Salpingoeca rosetta]EGD80408.1 hypothetical protein PTSG_11053 [Salpingoeca rosetta]|eukprot:XP_004987972.1 hypothetical protein PTSG_11053 [Salpingoeca rosetta]